MTIEQINITEEELREQYADTPNAHGLIVRLEICELARAALRQRKSIQSSMPTPTKSSHYLLRFLPWRE